MHSYTSIILILLPEQFSDDNLPGVSGAEIVLVGQHPVKYISIFHCLLSNPVHQTIRSIVPDQILEIQFQVYVLYT